MDPVQFGVSLALEAHRRKLIDDRALDAILAYYDNEGARDPFPPEEVLGRLGGVSPKSVEELVQGERPQKSEVQGERFSDRLTLLELIGTGGMGAVYRGYDRVLKRVVAVKRLKTDHLDASAVTRVLSRFEREAHAMARVRHPGCVQIFDAGLTKGGEPYLVMEFVAGKSLRGLLEERPRADPRQVAGWGAAMAEALQACHDVGLIHRDVKPGNILVDSQGELHLTDFGVAMDDRASTKITVERGMVGTLAYMAPEQALSEHLDGRSDVYSLGATLFEALTGNPPFDSPVTLVLLSQVLDSEAPTVRSRRSDCPEDLDTIITKCLAKSRDDRYATAAALALDLRRFLAGDPVLATRISPMLRASRRLWAHRRLLVGLAAAVSITAVGLGLHRVRAREQRRAAFESTLSDAAVASDVDAAEAAILPLFAQADRDQADRARETLRVLRGRRRLAEARVAIARWSAATSRARTLEAEALELRRRIAPQQAFAESPDKQRATAVTHERAAAEREAAVALVEAERALALASADLEGPEADVVRARLLLERGRVLERRDPTGAEALFRDAAAQDARAGLLAEELAPPVVEVRTSARDAEGALFVFEHDAARGRQLPREVTRVRAPGALTGAGADEYVVEVSAPDHLPCREVMLLTRGERRTFAVELVPRAPLGPLADLVVHIPPGEARWGEGLAEHGRVEAGLLLQKNEMTIDVWSSFLLCANLDSSYWPTLPRKDGKVALSSANVGLFPVRGVSWTEVQSFLTWLQSELDLAGIPYAVTLPTDVEQFRAVRGELPWVFPWGNEREPSFCGSSDGIPISESTTLAYLKVLEERRAAGLDRDDLSAFGVERLAGGVSELVECPAGNLSRLAYLGGTFQARMNTIEITLLETVPLAKGELPEVVGFRWALRPALRPSPRTPENARQEYERCVAEARRIAQANPGDLPQALPLATRAISVNPGNAAAWRLRAELRKRGGDAWGAAWDLAVAATRR